MSTGRHRRHAGGPGPVRRLTRTLAVALVAAGAVLAAVATDPKLLRLAVVLAALGAVAAAAGTGGRRGIAVDDLQVEVRALRATVDRLLAGPTLDVSALTLAGLSRASLRFPLPPGIPRRPVEH